MPINQEIPIPKREAQEYSPIPENVYQCELLDINMEEKPKYKKPEEVENVLAFQFTLLAGKDKDGTSLRGRNIWRNFVPTYLYAGSKGKNVLWQIIEALLGRELTLEEQAKLDTTKLNKLIGKQCRVVVKNNRKDDKIYSNIDTFMIIEESMQPLNEEEQEKARVKTEKVEQIENEEQQSVNDPDEINIDDIPF